MQILQLLANTTHQVAEPTAVKLTVTVLLSILFFFFGELYTEGLMAILMLMVIDTILGVGAAKKNGELITSRAFCRAVLKGTVYFAGISAGYYADLTIPFNVIQATMIAFVGCTEFISVLENISKFGYKTPKKLLNDLKDYQASR